MNRKNIDIKEFDLERLKELINSSEKINEIEKKQLIKFIKVFIKVSKPSISKKTSI